MLSLLLVLALQAPVAATGPNEMLWEAARAGDTARIVEALDKGADINAKGRYDVTPLFYAAMNGRTDAVKLLIARGADIHAVDTFYRARALDMAVSNGFADVGVILLQSGARGGDAALMVGVQLNHAALVQAALRAEVTRGTLQAALGSATQQKRDALIPLIKAAFDALPPEAPAVAFKVDPATLPRFAANYGDATAPIRIAVRVENGGLVAQAEGQPALPLVATAANAFRGTIPNGVITITFNGSGDAIESLTLVQGQANVTLRRVAAAAVAAAPAPEPPSAAPAPSTASPVRVAARNWPSFRGEGAAGNGDGQGAVDEWDAASGKNIKWKTPIPGIANSSPIVWGNRVFTTTAVSSAGDATFKTGLYGDVKPVEDVSSHTFKIYCLDTVTGRVVWERTAFTGVPKTKRHTKASQANSTPATDGRRVVAVFGAIGALVAWDMDGRELWRVDLGTLDSGWFLDPSYQWGHSSSPIIHDGSVIVQADVQKSSYLAAYDVATGKLRWKTARPDEISTWGTPAVVRTSNGRAELVTNGTKVRGYDPATGKQLWTLGPNSEITIPTPVVAGDLVIVTGGYAPVRPIYAIRPGASGDISLPKGQDASAAIAWSHMNEGVYIPTPLVYRDHLYMLAITGVVTAFEPSTGKRAFRGRVGTGGSFSASPVAADGKLYIATEDGDIHVVSAGPGLTPIAKNAMNEVIMATPAIADGLIFVRTMGHLYAIGR
jgi:outer membrane protein assembly factor BamB